MNRGSFVFPIAFLLLAGCAGQEPVAPDLSPEFAAAEVSWVEGEDFYSDFTSPVPCVGEDIRFTGYAWYRYHYVTNRNREIWQAQSGPVEGYQGVGMSSGDLWLLKTTLLKGTAQTEVWVAPVGEPFQVWHLTNARFDFENQRTGEVLSWPFRLHISRDASGEIKVSMFVEACRVR
jgi:hypothetical protein